MTTPNTEGAGDAPRATYDPGKEPVSSDKKFEALVSEADGFYRTVVTVSTAIMGGTLVFLNNVAKHPTRASIVVMGAGWVFLFAAIGAILYVRRQNLESLRQALRTDYSQASTIDVRTRRASTWAPILMIVGMALVGYSGLMNLWGRVEGGQEMEETRGTERTPLSIAGGDTAPKAPSPPPSSPEKPIPAPRDSGTADSSRRPPK